MTEKCLSDWECVWSRHGSKNPALIIPVKAW